MVRTRVEAEWLDAGALTLDAGGRLLIPLPAEDAGGLYMFRLIEHHNLMKFDVGQGGDLRSRTGAYRTNATPTDTRIRTEIVNWLTGDGVEPEVRLWVAYDCRVLFEGANPGGWQTGDLNSLANRLLAEAAAVAEALYAERDGVIVLNRLGIE